MKTIHMILAASVALAPVAASAQVRVLRPNPVQAIGPKQDDPLTGCPGSPGGREGIIVQGGLQPDNGSATPVGRGKIAIGPKQDDPRAPGSLVARPGDDEDPKAAGGTGTLAIGPKQDDPRAPGSAVARPGDDEDPKASGRTGTLAIGPKQDDPRAPGSPTADAAGGRTTPCPPAPGR